MTRTKGSLSVVACCCWLLACGHGEQIGEWSAPEPQPTPTGISGAVNDVVNVPQVKVPNVIEAEVDPRGGGWSGVHVTCKIPEAIPDHSLLVAETDVWAYANGDNDKVCLGQTHDLGEGFCRWVESQEARYRAIADCHKTALVQLDRMGYDAVANFGRVREGETWADLKKEYVPAAWAMTPEQAVADLGHFSGWIALLMDGTSAEVPANPFCFNKDREVTVRDARLATRLSLWWLHQLRQAKEQWVLSSLTRGVRVLVNPDMQPLTITVDVVVVPTLPNEPRCTFKLPLDNL